MVAGELDATARAVQAAGEIRSPNPWIATFPGGRPSRQGAPNGQRRKRSITERSVHVDRIVPLPTGGLDVHQTRLAQHTEVAGGGRPRGPEAFGERGRGHGSAPFSTCRMSRRAGWASASNTASILGEFANAAWLGGRRHPLGSRSRWGNDMSVQIAPIPSQIFATSGVRAGDARGLGRRPLEDLDDEGVLAALRVADPLLDRGIGDQLQPAQGRPVLVQQLDESGPGGRRGTGSGRTRFRA